MAFGVIVHYNTRSVGPGLVPNGHGKKKMNSRMENICKGILSLAVILLLAVAVISAQAHANLPADDIALEEFSVETGMGTLRGAESLPKLKNLPRAIDIGLALPIVVELGHDKLSAISDAARSRCR